MAALAVGAALAGGMVGIVATAALYDLRAATTERVVVDRHTGLAISGFDPVAYINQAQAPAGTPE